MAIGAFVGTDVGVAVALLLATGALLVSGNLVMAIGAFVGSDVGDADGTAVGADEGGTVASTFTHT